MASTPTPTGASIPPSPSPLPQPTQTTAPAGIATPEPNDHQLLLEIRTSQREIHNQLNVIASWLGSIYGVIPPVSSTATTGTAAVPITVNAEIILNGLMQALAEGVVRVSLERKTLYQDAIEKSNSRIAPFLRRIDKFRHSPFVSMQQAWITMRMSGIEGLLLQVGQGLSIGFF